MKKYKWTDSLKNTTTIVVRDDNAVLMSNQHKIPLSLSNVGFMIVPSRGTEETSRMVREAARKGLAELRKVTKLDWVEVK